MVDRARELEIALVLEGIEGVREIYALEPAERNVHLGWSYREDPTSEAVAFAIQVAPGGRALATAQCALLQILRHDECRKVAFFETFLPSRIAARARAIRLTVEERELARARVALLSPERVPPLRPRASTKGLSLLVVDADPVVARFLSTAPGSEGVGRLEVRTDGSTAASLALREQFDILLCAAESAFGQCGFLDRLLEEDSVIAARVILLSKAADREAIAVELERRWSANPLLEKPLSSDVYRLLADPAKIVPPWLIPIPAPRRPPILARAARAAMRILVIDDDPVSEAHLLGASDHAVEIVLSDNVWDALQHVATKDFDLVLCSVAMRADPTTPIYRFLWQSVPEMKLRFVLVLGPDAEPGSSATTSRRLMERPLTREAVDAAIARFFSA